MNKGNLYSRCKRGWNWHFTFGETTRDGNVVTVATQELLWRTKCGLETIVSGYPGGCREDSVALAIHEAIDNLKADAINEGVAISEILSRNFDSLVIGAPLDSEIVQGFAQALSRIRRVVVDIK